MIANVKEISNNNNDNNQYQFLKERNENFQMPIHKLL